MAPADIAFRPEMYVISEVDGAALFPGHMMLLSPDALFTDPRVPPAVRLCIPHTPELDKYTHQGRLIAAVIDPRSFCTADSYLYTAN